MDLPPLGDCADLVACIIIKPTATHEDHLKIGGTSFDGSFCHPCLSRSARNRMRSERGKIQMLRTLHKYDCRTVMLVTPARWDGDSCFRLAPWCMTKMSESAGGRVPVLCDLNEPFRAFTPAAAEAALRHRHFWSSRGRSPTVLVDLLAKPQGSPTASRDRENSNTQQSHKVLEHHLGLSEMPTSHGS
jgi:hypothetical protein